MKKVSKAKTAAVYARALYAAAAETKAADAVLDDVRKFLEVLAEDRSIVAHLANPVWDEADKKTALRDVAHKMKWNADTLRCLEVIADNRRFRVLPQILEEFIHIYYREHGIAEVEVGSVKPLSASQDKRLRSALEKMLNGKVFVTYKVMPELIGGLRIKFGSEMIDNTLASKLNRLENVMKGEQ